MWIRTGSRGASSSTSQFVAGDSSDDKLTSREAPRCFVEVYDQSELHQGHLVSVPQLLQCWTGGLLKRERVCSWLSTDLVKEVTDVYIQQWSLTADGMMVKLLLFDESRAKQEGSPFRNGARVVVCCSGEPLCIDAATRIQSMCPAQPLCRALTHGLAFMSSASVRSRECASRRVEIWTILEQLRSVVLWTEEASKRCSGNGHNVNAECVVLVYHLLLGLTLGTECLERLDAAREQLRQEYTAIRHALCSLNLNISHLFHAVRGGAREELHDGQDDDEDGTFYTDMLAVARRVLTGHSKIVGELAGKWLPLERLSSAGCSVVACTCLSGRSARPRGDQGNVGEEVTFGLKSSVGPLPPRMPGAARAEAESLRKGLETQEKFVPNLAQSLQAGAQLDQLWRSTHHI